MMVIKISSLKQVEKLKFCMFCYEFLKEDECSCPFCKSDVFVVDWTKIDVEDWQKNHIVRDEWK